MRILDNISSNLYEGFLPAPFEFLSLVKYPHSQDDVYHAHEGFQLIIPISGAFTVEDIKGNKYVASNGDVIIIPPHIKHIWRVEKHAETIQFCHEPFSLDEFGELHSVFGPGNDKIMQLTVDEKGPASFAAALQCEMTTNEAARGVKIYTKLLDLLVNILRHSRQRGHAVPGRNKEIISRSRNFIEKNYRKPIKLQDMARDARLGVSRFSEIFRNETGRSPINYINHLRIDKARSLLTFSIMSISEIADYLGFSSVHYFSRMFKKHTGSSPAEFRHNIRK